MIVKKHRLTFIDKLILWINYALIAALLISYLAPFTDPRKLWIIAFFGLAYPPLLLCNAILILYWLIRRSKWALLSFIAILLGWNVLNNSIGFRFSSAYTRTADSTTLRIMNYNVHDFKKYGAQNDSSTKHEILEIIDHQQPDIIGFEEFFSRKHGKYALVDSIKKILNTETYYFERFQKNGNQGIGMSLFSKYPIIDTGVIWLNEKLNLNQCIYIDVKKNNRTLRVYAIHLQSIKFDPEDYRYLNDVSSQGKTDMESSKRIGSKLKRAFIKRSEQVAKLKAEMAKCPYPYIVIGDFNDTPSSYAVHQMSKEMKNAFREKGSGLGRTYNGDFPNYQIDYILATKHFDILSYGVVRKKLSDHYPVYSDLRLRAE